MANIPSFKKYLTEALDSSAAFKQIAPLKAYLQKNLGSNIAVLAKERFRNKNGIFNGVPLVYDNGYKAVRINYKEGGEIFSINIWNNYKTMPNGFSSTPQFEVAIPQGQSIIKILPTILEIIQHPVVGKSYAVTSEDYQEEGLTESKLEKKIKSLMEAPFTVEGITYPSKYEAAKGLLKLGKTREEVQAALSTDAGYVNNAIKELKAVGGLPQDYAAGAPEKAQKISQSNSIGADVEMRKTYDSPEEIFKDVRDYTLQAIKKQIRGVLVAGKKGGTGKSFAVEQKIDEFMSNIGSGDGTGTGNFDGVLKVKGRMTAAALFDKLWQYHNGVILLDDCDDIWFQDEGVNILKAALDDKKNRVVSWSTRSDKYFDPVGMSYEEIKETYTSTGKAPFQFPFKGSIIMITNVSLSELASVAGPVLTRIKVVPVELTNEEMLQLISARVKIIPVYDANDQELNIPEDIRMKVFEFLTENVDNPNFDINYRFFGGACGTYMFADNKEEAEKRIRRDAIVGLYTKKR